MAMEQVLQNEIQESKRWLDKAEGVYKRDLIKRIELINWVLDNIKNPHIFICEIIESKINEIIDKLNKTNSIFEADPLDGELQILEWILQQVCSNEIKRL